MMKKEPLNEIKSLMERMEGLPGGYTGLLEEGDVNIARTTERVIDKSENFVDLLGGLKPGKMFTFGYVNVAKIEVPKYTVKTPGKRGKAPSFPDYPALGRNLGEEGELVNVIKLTMYNFPWQKQGYDRDKYGEDVPYELRFEADKPWNKQPSVKEKYAAWKNKRDELASKFGVTYGKANYGTEMNDFGGGITSYGGKNPELAKNTYLNFNLHGIKPFSKTFYLVFADGTIKKIDESKLKIIASERYDELKKLRDAGATEQDLEILLGMQYQRFENSQILFVSGTDTDGYPTLLINDNLSEKIIGKTGISREAIVNIARERYSKITKRDEFLNETKTQNNSDLLFIPKLKSSLNLIEALNLGRIEKHGKDGFVCLSANRSEIESSNERNDLKEKYLSWLKNKNAEDSKESKDEFLKRWNKSHDKDLLNDIISKGYTYSTTYGGYHGSDGVVDSYEPSFVVYNHKKSGEVSDWNELYNFAIEMCGKYYQDSVYVQEPGESPNYIDANGNKTNSSSSKNMKFNRDNETYYTTTKRDKDNPQRFTADIVFEGKYYRPAIGHEYVDRIRRTQYGEIFLG